MRPAPASARAHSRRRPRALDHAPKPEGANPPAWAWPRGGQVPATPPARPGCLPAPAIELPQAIPSPAMLPRGASETRRTDEEFARKPRLLSTSGGPQILLTRATPPAGGLTARRSFSYPQDCSRQSLQADVLTCALAFVA